MIINGLIKICIAIAIIATIPSCNNGNGIILIDNLPQPFKIEAERVNLKGAEFLTNAMFLTGDYIVCVNMKAPYAFNIYTKNFELADTIVRIGGGPNEVISANYFGQWSGNDSNPEILIFDDKRNRLSSLNINPFYDLSTIFDIPVSEHLNPSSVYRINDNLYVGVNLSIGKSSELFTYQPETKTVTRIPNQFTFDPMYGFYTSQCGLVKNTNGSGYVQHYFNIPWVLIYDDNFNLVHKIAINEEINPETLKSSNTGFIQMYYSGRTIAGLFRELTDDSTTITTIIIFDDNGDVKATIDAGSIYSFMIDNQNNRLITVNYDTNADEVYLNISKLPEILNDF